MKDKKKRSIFNIISITVIVIYCLLALLFMIFSNEQNSKDLIAVYIIVTLVMLSCYMMFIARSVDKNNALQVEVWKNYEQTMLFMQYIICFYAILSNTGVLTYAFGIVAEILICIKFISGIMYEKVYFPKMYVIDFAISVIICVYLLNGISNENLQDMLVTIVSALYGGLLTLLGVAWTIKVQRNVDREQARRKYLPYLKAIFDTTNYCLQAKYILDCDKAKYNIAINKLSIKNISSSLVVMDSINVDKIKFNFSGDIIIEQGQTFTIAFDELYQDNLLEKIQIKCEDAIGNSYILNCIYDYKIENTEDGMKRVEYIIKKIDIPKLEN